MMKLELSQAALTSPGRALSERSRWETSITRVVDRQMVQFLENVHQTALKERAINPTRVHDLYEMSVTSILNEIDANTEVLSILSEALGESSFPNEVYETTSYLLSETQALSDSELREVLTAGLDYDEPSIAEDGGLQASAVPRIIGQALARSTGRGKRWRNRTKETVRTAATGALNETQNRVLQRSDFTHKQWITRRDDHVRATHDAADGQTVPKASLFQVGSASLSYPGQGTYPPEEVYNCRCVMIAVNADGSTR